jgi:hypothetical protein
MEPGQLREFFLLSSFSFAEKRMLTNSPRLSMEDNPGAATVTLATRLALRTLWRMRQSTSMLTGASLRSASTTTSSAPSAPLFYPPHTHPSSTSYHPPVLPRLVCNDAFSLLRAAMLFPFTEQRCSLSCCTSRIRFRCGSARRHRPRQKATRAQGKRRDFFIPIFSSLLQLKTRIQPGGGLP